LALCTCRAYKLTPDSQEELRRLWPVWTDNQDLGKHVKEWERNPHHYVPEVSPFVKSLAGKCYSFAAHGEELLLSLAFLHEVLHMVLQPATSELTQGQRELIAHAASADEQGGPWAQLAGKLSDPQESANMRLALSSCLSRVHLAVPNQLLAAGSITVRGCGSICYCL
jgi:hypothetical protein